MSRVATLHRVVTVTWEDARAERTCDVAVTYEHNGTDHLEILDAEIIGAGDDAPYGISEDAFDALVDDEIAGWAADDYADWLSGQDGSD